MARARDARRRRTADGPRPHGPSSLASRLLGDQLPVQDVEAPFLGGEAAHLDAQAPHRVQHARTHRRRTGNDELLSGPDGGGSQGPHGLQQSRRPRGEAQPHHPALGQAVLELRGGQVGRQAAPHQHREPVGQALGVAELVRGEEHGPPVVPRALDHTVERAQAVRIEGRGGLVEQEHGGLGQQGHREPQPLHHAARVGGHRALARSVQRGEAKDLPAALAGRAPQLAVELHHLVPGEGVGEGDALRQVGQDPPRHRLGRGPGRITQLHGSGGGADEAGRRLEGGGLARPVGSEERHHLAPRHLEGQSPCTARWAPKVFEKPRYAIIGAGLPGGTPALRPRPGPGTPASRGGSCRRGEHRPSGRRGGRGGRASGGASSTGISRRTGNARSAAPMAAAAKLSESRSAAVRLPRKWSKTVDSR